MSAALAALVLRRFAYLPVSDRLHSRGYASSGEGRISAEFMPRMFAAQA
ncbi:hypothetical protein OV079_33530 [Nannocystis pusilla]|uniref:Uncharacterized protein n=1 Tax=Nannocystis pusilla TaxID=889268 RepID=A0A9X3J0U3_9BACT|nr:hypothetical protein [Nannocystis pusilla]MCY1010405.1 hypothetical protein [Nannocystis pusilla]